MSFAGGNKKLIFIVILAVIARLVLSAFTFHGDILFIWSVPTYFLSGVIDYFNRIGGEFPQALNTNFPVYYPPVSYLFTGLWLYIVRYFSPTLILWLSQVRDISLSFGSVQPGVIFPLISLTELRWNLVLLKSSYILIDLLITAIIYKVVVSRKLLAASIYLFNPITLFSVYMLGQIDNLTLLLILLFLYLAVKSPKFSLIPLALSAGVKTLPLFFFAPFAIVISRNLRNAVISLLLTVMIFILINLPWAGNSFLPLLKSYFPPFISPFTQLALRPDSLWGIFRIAAAAITGVYLSVLYLKSKKIINQSRITYLTIATVCLFFSAYSAVKVNYYVILVGLFSIVWVERPNAIKKITIFSLLWIIAYIYTRPLMGEMLSPILGWEDAASLLSLRDLVNPIFKYEHLGLLARMILDMWILREACHYGTNGLRIKSLTEAKHY